jgi:hypothetical protein
MRSRFLAHAIDPEQVWQAYGSKDRLLLEFLLSDRAAEVDRLPGGAALLAAYINGTPPPVATVHHNLRVVGLLAAVLGRPLDSDGWERTDADFVAEVGVALGRCGVRLPLWDLFHRWPPQRVPARSDHDAGDTPLGYLDANQVAALAPALAGVASPDRCAPAVMQAIACLREWFAAAAGQRAGLMCLSSRSEFPRSAAGTATAPESAKEAARPAGELRFSRL